MRMKWLIPVCFFSILAACNNVSPFGKKLADSDSLVIVFTDTLSGNVVKSMQATTTAAIKKVSGFVDSKPVEVFKCGYDGNLYFYKQGALTGEVSFQFNKPGCRHFLFKDGDELTSTEMSNEAADFFKGMVEGRDFY